MLRYGSFSIIFTAIFWQGKWAGFILGAEERGKNFDTVVSKKKKKKRKTTALLRHSSCACLQQPESSQRGAGCVLASHCSMACFSPLPSAEFLHFISWQLILACIIHIYGTALGHPWPRLCSWIQPHCFPEKEAQAKELERSQETSSSWMISSAQGTQDSKTSLSENIFPR